ncbi:isochorismatase family protein [Kitasatospora sp. CB01950]|uniref:isochorismatase family protein n=1 Tax=Kitasatospora sp. CB01950 TaxID=1703930 RepID=UPI00093E6E4F|nr:isochorismatase family protein [Kitasatospora sp. CB01950]
MTVLRLPLAVGNTVLVLIDHQVGTIEWAGELTGEDEREQLRMWVRTVVRFAAAVGIPVVLTSSLEDQQQGPLLPDLEALVPTEYAARVQRTGVINAWDDPAFVGAVRATGRRNLLIGGLTTEVCLVPPVLSAIEDGFGVAVLLDVSAAGTRTAAVNSRDAMRAAGAELLTVVPAMTRLLGSWRSEHAAAFFDAMGSEGVFAAYARGNLR